MRSTAVALETTNRVPRLATTGVVVCLATGPSLTQADVDYCRGKATVVAVQDAWRLAPWADVLYSSDRFWFPFYGFVPEFDGLKVAFDEVRAPGVVTLGYHGPDGLSLDPTKLVSTKNSGGAAINLAVHLGAKRIILLGYDMQATGGKRHFFGDHPKHTPIDNAQHFAHFLDMIETMVAPLAKSGVEVVNCTPTSALRCFRTAALRDEL